MFWNDLAEIKSRLKNIEQKIDRDSSMLNTIFLNIRPAGVVTEENEFDESVTLSQVNNSLCEVLDTVEAMESKLLSVEVVDKFDDYMKNVDKLNTMVNEVKGCVAVARASLQDRKDYDAFMERMDEAIKYVKSCRDEIVKSKKEAQSCMEYSKSLSNQYFKIDAIYRALVEEKPEKKKPGRPKKPKVIANESL